MGDATCAVAVVVAVLLAVVGVDVVAFVVLEWQETLTLNTFFTLALID